MKKYISILVIVFALVANTAWAKSGGFSLPKYEKFTLKNGLTVYLMEQHEVPLIYVSGKFMAGAILDDDKSGLASMTASALKYGTANHTKAELEEELDFLGASLAFYAASEYAGLYASFAAKDQDLVLGFMKDALLTPAFDEEEFNKAKTRAVTNLNMAKDSPDRVVSNYFNSYIYKDHPYANPTGGTPAGVESLNIDDIKAFYKENYNPANACIAIVGDFNAKEMRKKITALFKDWKAKPVKKQKMATPDLNFSEGGLYFINKDDANISTFMIGGKGIARNNEDFVALRVINTILGGRFTSWLNNELRINHGLTYGVRSRFSTKKLGGTFAITSFSANNTSLEAMERAVNVLDSLHRVGINAETLQSAKNYVKGLYPRNFETSGDLAELLSDMYFFDFDEKFINTFNKNVDGLSVEKTNQLVAKYFPKENLQFVVIGKKEFFGDALDKYGKITLKEIKEDGY